MNKDNKVVKILAGSRLYGCDISTSDYDYKEIIIPSLDNILFTKIHNERIKEANYEIEQFPIITYMKYLCEGQVITVDMLFAPDKFILESSDLWEHIKNNKEKYFNNLSIIPFAKYAKNQAELYGNKQKKLTSLNLLISLLEKHISFSELKQQVNNLPGISFYKDSKNIEYINVCEKKFSETTDYKLWLPPLKALYESFGERVKSMPSGLDTKASYHAVRIISEAIELLTLKKLTFPRPEAELLLNIRNNKLSYEEISSIIENRFIILNNLISYNNIYIDTSYKINIENNYKKLIKELYLKENKYD